MKTVAGCAEKADSAVLVVMLVFALKASGLRFRLWQPQTTEPWPRTWEDLVFLRVPECYHR